MAFLSRVWTNISNEICTLLLAFDGGNDYVNHNDEARPMATKALECPAADKVSMVWISENHGKILLRNLI